MDNDNSLRGRRKPRFRFWKNASTVAPVLDELGATREGRLYDQLHAVADARKAAWQSGHGRCRTCALPLSSALGSAGKKTRRCRRPGWCPCCWAGRVQTIVPMFLRLRSANRRVALSVEEWGVTKAVLASSAQTIYATCRPRAPGWQSGEVVSWTVIVPGLDAETVAIVRFTVGACKADLRQHARPEAELDWGQYLGAEPREIRSEDRLVSVFRYPAELLHLEPAIVSAFGSGKRLFARYNRDASLIRTPRIQTNLRPSVGSSSRPAPKPVLAHVPVQDVDRLRAALTADRESFERALALRMDQSPATVEQILVWDHVHCRASPLFRFLSAVEHQLPAVASRCRSAAKAQYAADSDAYFQILNDAQLKALGVAQVSVSQKDDSPCQ